VAITFDDGWLDTAEVAGPLALEHRIPLTVFVCPELTGQISPFWPERIIASWRLAETSDSLSQAYSVVCADVFGDDEQFRPGIQGNVERLIDRVKELSGETRRLFVQNLSELVPESRDCSRLEATMSWQTILNWAQCGNHVGAHGDRHEILTNLNAEDARHEIDGSKHQIEINLNQPCVTFAYPNGSWSQEAKRLVVQAGFQQAFVNSPGIWKAQTDPWLIPRVNIWEGSLAGVTGKFSSAVFEYTVFWRSYRKQLRSL
jgi:peptidoglycan/xylan/chitin deacetylase (PgdA/CDA1 family)